MKNKISFSALLIVLIFSATSALAWPGNDKQGTNCDRRRADMSAEQHYQQMKVHLEKMTIILDLSEEQQDKIKTLSEKHWQERQELRSKMQLSHADLREYRFNQDVDVEEYRTKARHQADLKADTMAQKSQHKKSLFAIMTPEQQKKAKQLWEIRGGGTNFNYKKQGQLCRGARNRTMSSAIVEKGSAVHNS